MKALKIKKLFILVLFLILQNGLEAQSWFYFEGQITHLNGIIPIESHEVFISANDSVLTATITDFNGYYIDSIFASQTSFRSVEVIVFDCNDQIHSQQFDPPSQFNTANFSICNYYPECEALFYYEADFQQPLLVNFIDLSEGNIDTWFWDFGDGNFSSEINPVHQYSETGVYEVSLMISDTMEECNSLFTMTINVGEDNQCNADFNFINDMLNPLFVHFVDQSSGEISQWQWDFGDGNFSFQQNPSHLYSESGFYNVCLTISNNLTTCFDTICMNIVVEDSLNCSAEFEVTLDTLNNTPFTYLFTHISSNTTNSWFWDFGDGNFSYEQNPIHTFEMAGDYLVCLSIIADSSDFICSDTKCKSISTMQYFSFGGHAFVDGFPINIDENDSSNIATAYLYRKFKNQWKYMDEREFWKFGYYWFVNKLEGDYLLRIDLNEGSLDFDSYSPSYFENSCDWRNANTFNLNNSDQFALDINMHRLSDLNNGIGSISGNIYDAEYCETQIDLSHQIVKLFNSENNYVAFEYTDESGEFEFSSLAFGSYILKAEVTGSLSTSDFADINSSNPFSENHILEIDCDSYVGVEENETVNSDFEVRSIYPIPANDFVNVKIYSVQNKNIEFELLDIMGRLVETNLFTISSGENIVQLNIQSLQSGLYVFKIKSSNNQILETGKIIVN